METDHKVRGYDDSAYLKQMADGLVTREYGAVDEAAKAVLDEESGSNVDRLRRKFREQGWYERGLQDYVQTEIKKRGMIKGTWATRLVSRLERSIEDPRPAFAHFGRMLFVFLGCQYDRDGLNLTRKERCARFVKFIAMFAIPGYALSALFHAIRAEHVDMGSSMLGLAVAFVAMGFGMANTKISLFEDLRPYVDAEAAIVSARTARDRALGQRRAEERRALEEKVRSERLQRAREAGTDSFAFERSMEP